MSSDGIQDSSFAFGQTFYFDLQPDGTQKASSHPMGHIRGHLTRWSQGQFLGLRPNNMRAPVSEAACSMRAQRGATADAGASLQQIWKPGKLGKPFFLGFGASQARRPEQV